VAGGEVEEGGGEAEVEEESGEGLEREGKEGWFSP
jgi:hypothetical protein